MSLRHESRRFIEYTPEHLDRMAAAYRAMAYGFHRDYDIEHCLAAADACEREAAEQREDCP